MAKGYLEHIITVRYRHDDIDPMDEWLREYIGAEHQKWVRSFHVLVLNPKMFRGSFCFSDYEAAMAFKLVWDRP